MNKQTIKTGFSLLELLIVVAVVALLSALGVSSYQQQVIRSAMLQGQTDLLTLAAKMEEFKLIYATYEGAAGKQNESKSIGLPWIHNSYSPSSGSELQKRYDLYIQAADNTSYELKAVPTSTKYPALLFKSSGSKYRDKNSDGVFSENEACWQC